MEPIQTLTLKMQVPQQVHVGGWVGVKKSKQTPYRFHRYRFAVTVPRDDLYFILIPTLSDPFSFSNTTLRCLMNTSWNWLKFSLQGLRYIRIINAYLNIRNRHTFGEL